MIREPVHDSPCALLAIGERRNSRPPAIGRCVEVQLPEDSLASDNRRYAALDISVANPVLIIDGDPESDDGSYVLNALAAATTKICATITMTTIVKVPR